MGAISRDGWVTLQYDGAKAPDHMRGQFTVKGVTFRSGVPMEVDPRFADVALASAPTPGSLRVVKGTPVAAPNPSTVAAAKALEARVGTGAWSKGAREVALADKPAAPAAVKDRA